MSERTDIIELVRRAQEGRPEARGDLVRIVEPRLAEYVGRLTLDRDLTTDIVQESIAEMLKIFDSLKDPQRFWCWIYTITLNKLRAHYRKRWRHKETPLSEVQQDWLEAKDQDVLADLVARELKQIVVCAVGELEPRQRAVLVMRCYDQMSYGEISRAMGCTQLGARALFHRAKKSMARLLNAYGIDKSALPVALLIFGKLSAASEAAVSGVSITASALRVGPWGAIAAMAARHVVLTVALGTAAIGASGVMIVVAGRAEDGPPAAIAMASVPQAGAVSQETSCWCYYPPGSTGTVMIRTGGRAIAYSQWLGKEQANYYRQGDTIRIRNHRQFTPDLSVWRLPTDKPELRSFLRAQDGWSSDLDYAASSPRGMLVAVEKAQGGRLRQTTLNYDVSVEDYFRHDWSADATVVDERDELHRQGWAWFEIRGRIDGRPVSGGGRLPFVAAAAWEHGPWLSLTVGDDRTMSDAGTGAGESGGSGSVPSHYSGGGLFQGLGRPWTGLHTIDTIRRDAAAAKIPFATRRLPDGERVEIVLDGPRVQLTYRVHLYQDWIESITLRRGNALVGELMFNYSKLRETQERRPAASMSPQGGRGQGPAPDGLWLMRLDEGLQSR
ncbi:MAG TPA: sigma-70 family RNA polymerase sigma factor [Sedimentisphaerales bacterium]|nr:sigma-70 family RNA polymerase sigma factor [Sedimentisphaerales bacterium]